jgi:hypothetical protein
MAALVISTTSAVRRWKAQASSGPVIASGRCRPGAHRAGQLLTQHLIRHHGQELLLVQLVVAQEAVEDEAREAAIGPAQPRNGEGPRRAQPRAAPRGPDGAPRFAANIAGPAARAPWAATARRIFSSGSKRLPSWRAMRDISRRAAAWASGSSIALSPTRTTALSRPKFRTTSSIPQTRKEARSSMKRSLAGQVPARRRIAVSMRA